MITDTQSHALVIRNVFYDAVKRLPFFAAAAWTSRKTKLLAIQPHLLPFLGVYIVDETMMPDGDGNAGHIRFSHTLRVGFSVIVQNNDQVALELTLDAAFWAIMNGLWRDEYVMNMLDTWNPALTAGNPDNVRVESIQRGVRRHLFGATGANNELPIGEMQYDVSAFWRAEYAPVIPDDLLEIDMTTGLKPGETPEERAKRLQVNAHYTFTPTP